jgi:hypothetical protein
MKKIQCCEYGPAYVWLLNFLAFISMKWKRLTATNTLAYFIATLNTAVKYSTGTGVLVLRLIYINKNGCKNACETALNSDIDRTCLGRLGRRYTSRIGLCSTS